VRLADAIFRGGHLSDDALVQVVTTGERPVHFDRCDICAERAVDVSRWLDHVRNTGLEAADAAFPAERLAAQQAHILRRLEQIDHPARVIAFPTQTRSIRESSGRRVAPAWLGVAAAAGVLFGIVSVQLTSRLIAPHTSAVAASQPATPSPAPAPIVEPRDTPGSSSGGSALYALEGGENERVTLSSLRALDAVMTPTMMGLHASRGRLKSLCRRSFFAKVSI